MLFQKWIGLGVALLIGVVISIFYWFGLLHSWQENIFDRLFLKSEPPPNVVILGIDDESIGVIGNWPWPRKVFADALAQLSAARAVGIDVAFSEKSRLGEGDDLNLQEALKAFPGKVVLPVQFDDRGGRVFLPNETLRAEAALGFVNVIVDQDAVARKLLVERTSYKAFSAEILNSKEYPQVFRISYTGPAKTFATIPFVDVYQGKIPESILKDKIVLIGATANDLQDFVQTPFGRMPGVELHANAIATLQGGTFLKEIPRTLGIFLIVITSLLSYLLIKLVKRFWLLLTSLALLLVLAFVSGAVAFSFQILLPILYLLLAGAASSVALVILQYFTESKEKRFIQKTFAYYLVPEVIDDLLKDPSKLRLGGEKRKVTIFFSDIRGFTTISEKLSAEELTHLINEYLTAMTDIIMEERGLVDKYIGDAIMAFWGAPVPNQNQAKDAARSVLKMSAKLGDLNKVWEARGVPTLGIGAGLNTGEVVVGNMGSEKRFNYTIMGDQVNFGSRLEGITKQYGVQCIISESTAMEIMDESEFTVRELDLVMVKGKKEPKKIFELLTKPVTDITRQQLAHFKVGREAYIAGRFEEAISHFENALSFGEDGPSSAFVERCKYLKEHPPEDWNGVYEFKTK